MQLLTTCAFLALTLVGVGPFQHAATDAVAPVLQGQEPGKQQDGDKDKAKAAEIAWLTDYKAALAAAKKQKKVVLMDFTGSDWCVWCKRLDEEVFSKSEFRDWAAKHVILLQVDFPRGKQLPKEQKEQNDKLQKEFSITGFPTIMLVDAKGKKVGQLGYIKGGPEAWIKEADKQLKKKK